MYIQSITGQFNWSGPLSLAVVCSLNNLGVDRSIPSQALDKIFFTDFSPLTTQVYLAQKADLA